jgi:hypothetical protein
MSRVGGDGCDGWILLKEDGGGCCALRQKVVFTAVRTMGACKLGQLRWETLKDSRIYENFVLSRRMVDANTQA